MDSRVAHPHILNAEKTQSRPLQRSHSPMETELAALAAGTNHAVEFTNAHQKPCFTYMTDSKEVYSECEKCDTNNHTTLRLQTLAC